VRYSPNGSRIAAASTDGLLSVFEVRTGRVIYRAQAPEKTPFYGLDWSPDSALIAAGAGDHSIYVFRASNGSLYDTLVGHGTLVTAVAWSPNGRTLASTAGGLLVSEGLNQVSDGPDNAVHFWARH
jgi:WD40 repeat protein